MKALISLCVLIISSIQILSQYNEDYTLGSFWDFYGYNYLSTLSAGKGFTGIASENDISGILLNPASINIEKKYQINAQYTFKTTQEWLHSDNISLKQQLFSGSLGFGYRINKHFQTGFVYNNPSGHYFGGELIWTNEFGNEIRRTDYFINTSVHSFNVPFTYSNDKFEAGVNLSYTYSRYTIPREAITTLNNPMGFSSGDDFLAYTSIFRAQGGFIAKLSDYFSFGASVTSGGKSKVKETFPDGSKTDTMEAIQPWKIGVGIQYAIPNSNWKLLADYNYTRTSESRMLQDRHDIHFGIENEINKNWTVRGGFFTLFDYRSSSTNYLDPPHDYDQFFITGGFSYKQRNMILSLAVLSSMLSTGSIKNIYTNGGLTFNF